MYPGFDELTAANLVLQVDDGAIVDIGGGTTGMAVIKDGKLFIPATSLRGEHTSL